MESLKSKLAYRYSLYVLAVLDSLIHEFGDFKKITTRGHSGRHRS